jgi:hypothetical protein
MAETVSYRAIMSKALLASGQDTLQYTPGPSETFYIKRWLFVSTGAFDVIDVRNSEQYKYTQCSVTNPIPSTLLQDARNAFRSDDEFDPPLKIEPSQTFSIDVKDTSAVGNTVRFLLVGYKVIS